MANAQINYKKLVLAINSQFSALKDQIVYDATQQNPTDYATDLYNETKEIKNIIVEDEQMFIKERDINPNNIYVVIKFGGASVNFAASICSVNLMIWGSENKIKPTQMLLSSYVSYFNNQQKIGLGDFEIDNVSQLWASPSVSTNFNESQTGFRNILTLNGTLVIGQETVEIGSIEYYYGDGANDHETIGMLSYNQAYQNSPNSQPFPNSEGFAITETNFATFSFSISTYSLNNHFTADLLHIQGFEQSGNGITSNKKPNDPFKMIITFSNGFTNTELATGKAMFSVFKCISCTIGKQIGGVPTLNVGFSR